jgi:hypothetical protein
MAPWQDTFAISALQRKRAHLAGEIEAAERALSAKREVLANLDGVIRLFSPETNPELIPAIRPSGHPAIRPCSKRSLFFKHGQQLRLCFAALREAGKPVPTRQLAAFALEAKGLAGMEGRERAAFVTQIRPCLIRMERRGYVRKVVTEPEVWWDLITN